MQSIDTNKSYQSCGSSTRKSVDNNNLDYKEKYRKSVSRGSRGSTGNAGVGGGYGDLHNKKRTYNDGSGEGSVKNGSTKGSYKGYN